MWSFLLREDAQASRVARALAGLAGFGWFVMVGGLGVLNPTHLEWMMRDDWVSHLTGWLFFRQADWSLPLTSAPGLFYPYGTSVAFTDGLPWFAVFFKLCSALLPIDFQYIGLWWAISFSLLGYFGARLTSVFSPVAAVQVLGGTLVSISPTVLARLVHPTLCGHFIIVAFVWLTLRGEGELKAPGATKKAVALALGLVTFAAGAHVYWVVMALALTTALALRLWRAGQLRVVGALALVGVSVGLAASVLWLFGLLGGSGTSVAAEGFGQFSADLTSPFNPLAWSHLIPAIPVGPRQGEGFGFVGVGALGLLVFSLATLRRGGRWRSLRDGWPLLVALIPLTVFAWATPITFAGHPLVDLGGFYRALGPRAELLRASGRFIWVLQYSLVALALSFVLSWKDKPRLQLALLVIAIGVQAYDLRPADRVLTQPPIFTPLTDTAYEALGHDYQHVALFPVQAQWTCSYYQPQVTQWALLAYRQHMTFNSGYASRTPDGVAARCGLLFPENGLQPDTVYVVTREAAQAFLQAGARCNVMGRDIVCVHPQHPTRLLAALERPPG